MDEKIKKSLTELIDETLMELEELKKSRYSAAEMHMGDEKGLDGHPANGSMGKDEDKDEDDEDKDMDKGEGTNRQADPDGGHHKPAAGEGMKNGQGPSSGPKGSTPSSSGTNRQADPDATNHPADGGAPMVKDEDKDDHDEKDEKKDKKGKEDKKDMHAFMKKSQEEMSDLMKSFVDERVKPLEDKLSTLLEIVNKMADQPVAPKGFTANAVPLMKSTDDGAEPLTKSAITAKLLELKKSGEKVDTLDITKADLGQDLGGIAKKYKLS